MIPGSTMVTECDETSSPSELAVCFEIAFERMAETQARFDEALWCFDHPFRCFWQRIAGRLGW